jgi:hypothetical protein
MVIPGEGAGEDAFENNIWRLKMDFDGVCTSFF